MTEDKKIALSFLDHVAIRVADLETSAKWYEDVLGLKRYQLPEWGDFPIFMLCGKSGVALFPARLSDKRLDGDSKNVKIDHFAFNVTRENFEKAKRKYRFSHRRPLLFRLHLHQRPRRAYRGTDHPKG